MGPWTCSPLVSAPRFGRWFGKRFGRTNPAYAKREKALSFLLIISANQALVPRTHNPLVPGSTRASPTRCERTASASTPARRASRAAASNPGGPTNPFKGLGDLGERPGDKRSLGLWGVWANQSAPAQVPVRRRICLPFTNPHAAEFHVLPAEKAKPLAAPDPRRQWQEIPRSSMTR